jgi:hypothetical protein
MGRGVQIDANLSGGCPASETGRAPKHARTNPGICLVPKPLTRAHLRTATPFPDPHTPPHCAQGTLVCAPPDLVRITVHWCGTWCAHQAHYPRAHKPTLCRTQLRSGHRRGKGGIKGSDMITHGAPTGDGISREQWERVAGARGPPAGIPMVPGLSTARLGVPCRLAGGVGKTGPTSCSS